jgi:hypothetical protein
MRTRDVEILAEAYDIVRETALSTIQTVGQNLKTAGRVMTNPAAASAAFGSWVQTDNIDSAKAAFKQKEGEQALDKIIQLAGVPSTDDNRKKIHDAVADVVFGILGAASNTVTPQPVTPGATPAISMPPTTPSSIAVRPK